MTLENASRILLYCALFNAILLGFWSLIAVFCREWMHRLTRRYFPVPVEQLDAIHLTGILVYKIGFLLLNLVPWLALRLVM